MDADSRKTKDVLNALWEQLLLPQNQLEYTGLTGPSEVMPSSFYVTTAAHSSIAAAASAACLIAGFRTDRSHSVTVDSFDAARECTSFFTIDGETPPMWAAFSGMYKTQNGHIRVHANFDHHRDCFLEAIGLTASATHEAAAARVMEFCSEELDVAITELGGACAALRQYEQWDALPQADAINAQPLISISKVADAAPRRLIPLTDGHGALHGLRVLDLTRILAGPVCGRTLAAYGAEVMLVNSPNLPNIDNIIDTSRGKLSAHCDLTTQAGVTSLNTLLEGSDVFIQGYRPGALAQLGFDAESMCKQHPGLVAVSLSAYGNSGPWCNKRGFDSLVQTATGFNAAEASAFKQTQPKPMPVQILDYATGFLMAFGAQAALYKQLTEGGSYHVEVSLARTALWLRQMGQTLDHLHLDMPIAEHHVREYSSGYGKLMALPHAAVFSDLPNRYARPSVPPGTHEASWQASPPVTG